MNSNSSNSLQKFPLLWPRWQLWTCFWLEFFLDSIEYCLSTSFASLSIATIMVSDISPCLSQSAQQKQSIIYLSIYPSFNSLVYQSLFFMCLLSTCMFLSTYPTLPLLPRAHVFVPRDNYIKFYLSIFQSIYLCMYSAMWISFVL